MRLFLVWLICIFVFASPLQARSLTITSDKTALSNDEEMLLNITPSGFASDEAIFVKGAFYQEGNSNYFGLTKSGDNWIKNSASSSDQYNVKMSDWDNKLYVKSDFTDSGFKGNGDYKFKVGFYYTTSGGNISSINWSTNILTIALHAPDPTPVPSPTPTKTPAPTRSPSPMPIKSIVTTPSPISKSQIVLQTPTATYVGDVLGVESTPSLNSENNISTNSADVKNKIPVTGILLVGLGVMFIVASVYMAFQTQKSHHTLK